MTLALAVVLLPFLAAAVLIGVSNSQLRARLDFAACLTALALAGALALGSPWDAADAGGWPDAALTPFLLADRIGALFALLVAVAAAAQRWRRLRRFTYRLAAAVPSRRSDFVAWPVAVEIMRIAAGASPAEGDPDPAPSAEVSPRPPDQRSAALRRPSREAARPVASAAGQVALGGLLAACLAADPLVAWLGLVVAAAATWYPRGNGLSDRVLLTAVAFGLAMFGDISLHAVLPGALAAPLCLMVGYAILAAVLPVTLPAVLLVLVRHQALLAGTALGTRMDMLMIWFGLAAALGCGLLLAGAVEARRGTLVPPALMPMGTIALGQGAIAVFAFGLGSPDAAFAATLHLVLLVLTGAAAGLSRAGEVSRCAALAGLAGIPPFGVFPSLVLILLAAARQSPWTVAPLAVSLALLGWGSVRRLPPLRPSIVTAPGRTRRRPASPAPERMAGEQVVPERNMYAGESALPVSLDAIPAWLPLVLALLIGLLMPDSLAEWLRQASAGLP